MLDNHVGQLPLVAEAANDLPIFCNDVWLAALQFAQQDQPRVDDENPADRCSTWCCGWYLDRDAFEGRKRSYFAVARDPVCACNVSLRIFRPVRTIPMICNVLARAKPDTIVLARVVEKLHQANRLRWPTNEAVVQGHSHDLWSLCAFLVKQIEAIVEVGREVIRRAEAIVLIKAVVVGFK